MVSCCHHDVSVGHNIKHDNKHMVALKPNAEKGYALTGPLSQARSSPLSASGFAALASTNVTVKSAKPFFRAIVLNM